MSNLPPRGQGTRPPGIHCRGSGSAPPAPPPTSAAGSLSLSGGALPISPDPTTTRATYLTISDLGTAQPHQEMEVEGTQGGEEFRDTVEDLLGDLEVLTTSVAKATDWILRAVHHDPLSIDGGDAFVAQMTSFVNAVMATDFSRIHGPGELDNFSLASLLEAETSSKDEPTIHPAPIFRPPPPAACGPLDKGVADVGAPPDVLMQALDDLGRLASPSRIPASKKHKGVDCLVLPPPQKKSKVAYSHPGLPPPINRATKPKPRLTTWAGIA
ncbi:unnamed protein product [Cyclocybe aegerita]|uniref:Uncharacterized protein n=1 Tax=Cyclocybe aegerita TaxID=1973307 RepID=A0A8S0XJP7_CYCAE|nr:unnamed protein product [Cyclocybe aegerita]